MLKGKAELEERLRVHCGEKIRVMGLREVKADVCWLVGWRGICVSSDYYIRSGNRQLGLE